MRKWFKLPFGLDLSALNRLDQAGVILIILGVVVGVILPICLNLALLPIPSAEPIRYERGVGLYGGRQVFWLYWPMFTADKLIFLFRTMLLAGLMIAACGGQRRRDAFLGWGWGSLCAIRFRMVWVNYLGWACVIAGLTIDSYIGFVMATLGELETTFTGVYTRPSPGPGTELGVISLIVGLLLLVGGFLRARTGGMEPSALLLIAGGLTIAGAFLWMCIEALLAIPNVVGPHLILPALVIALGLFLGVIGGVPLMPFSEEDEDSDCEYPV